ncbi:MAG: GGDEF domain-containing protein, partial [Planctomycetales bacterium]|nr:GGDEF domain-containing protein [Planctomycetales bacterium]
VVGSVRFATYLSEFLLNGSAESLAALKTFGQELTGLCDTEFDELLTHIRTSTDEAAKLLSINTSNLPRPADILAQANTQLLEIALREHVAKSEVTIKSAVLELENRKLKQRNTELNQLTGVDALTGLNNRGAFDECFERLVDSCLRESHLVGVIFADIDNFKQLNDTYGHQLGDEVLRRVAKIIKSQVRESDFVARYGGEEFVVITSRCPEHVIATIAERIRSRVEEEYIEYQDHQIQVTVSVGVCVTTEQALPINSSAALANSILQEADSAMYHCKRTGRNQTFIRRWETSIKSIAHNP